MAYSTPEQLSFHPVAGHTIRADCEGGALSSDFGALLPLQRHLEIDSGPEAPYVTLLYIIRKELDQF